MIDEQELVEYDKQLNDLNERLDKRNEKTKFIKGNLEENTYGKKDMESWIKTLDKLRRESRMDIELKDDILNMLEVEHFLAYGNGQNFDQEY